jgi:hypothetical protein
VSGGEKHHIDGQDGVALAKRWLEGTGRFSVHWHSGQRVAVPYLGLDQLDGSKVGFDILAQHDDPRGEARSAIWVEVKNYNAQGGQLEKYSKFLVDCTSAVMLWEQGTDENPSEFMWLTWHPFGATDKYLRHVTAEAVKEACTKKYPVKGKPDEEDYRLPQDQITNALCENVAKRLWFVIAPRRLNDMLLPPS